MQLNRRQFIVSGGAAGAAWMPSSARADELRQRQFVLPPFDSIDSRLACSIELAAAAQQSVSVQAEPKVLEALQVRSEGRTLILDAGSYQTRQAIVVTIGFKALRRIDVSGSGRVSLKGLKADELNLRLDGTTDFGAIGLNLTRLRLDSRGSDEVMLKGTAGQVDLVLEGSGSLQAKDLVSDSAQIRLSGSGDAEISVRKQLSVVLEGSGSLRYFGRPAVTRRGDGSGELVNASTS